MDMAVMQKIVDSLSVKELLAVKEKIEEVQLYIHKQMSVRQRHFSLKLGTFC